MLEPGFESPPPSFHDISDDEIDKVFDVAPESGSMEKFKAKENLTKDQKAWLVKEAEMEKIRQQDQSDSEAHITSLRQKMGLDTPTPLKAAKKQYLAVTPEELEKLRSIPLASDKPSSDQA